MIDWLSGFNIPEAKWDYGHDDQWNTPSNAPGVDASKDVICKVKIRLNPGSWSDSQSSAGRQQRVLRFVLSGGNGVEGLEIHEAEQRVFGFDHADVGEALLKRTRLFL